MLARPPSAPEAGAKLERPVTAQGRRLANVPTRSSARLAQKAEVNNLLEMARAGEWDTVTDRLNGLIDEREEARHQRDAALDEHDRLERHIEKAEEAKDKALQEKDKAEEQLAEVQRQLTEAQTQTTRGEGSTVPELKRQLGEARARLARANADLRMSQAEMKSARTQAHALRDLLTAAREATSKERTEKEALSSKYNVTVTEIYAQRQRISDMEKERMTLQQQLDELRANARGAEVRIDELTTILEERSLDLEQSTSAEGSGQAAGYRTAHDDPFDADESIIGSGQRNTSALAAAREEVTKLKEDLLNERALNLTRVPNEQVLVRMPPLIFRRDQAQWRTQLNRTFGVMTNEFGSQEAAKIVREASGPLLLDQPAARTPQTPNVLRPRFGDPPVTTAIGGTDTTNVPGGETNQPVRDQQQGMTAPTARTPPATLADADEQRIRNLEELATRVVTDRLNQQQQQPPAQPPAQPQQQQVFLSTPTLPAFDAKAVKGWMEAARAALAPLPYSHALQALVKALGNHYGRIVNLYGATPETINDWYAAIRTAYPEENPMVAAKKVKEMRRGTQETLAAFVSRAITASRETEWAETQAVNEIIDICENTDAIELRRGGVPETRLTLLEKARELDRNQHVGRRPAKTTVAKGKQPATTAAVESTTNDQTVDTSGTSTSYAQAVTSAVPARVTATKQQPTGKGAQQVSRQPQGRTNEEESLASRLARIEKLLQAGSGAQAPSQPRANRQTRDFNYQPGMQPPRGGRCFECGGAGHVKRDCPSAQCATCGQRGHWAIDCVAANNRQSQPVNENRQPRGNRQDRTANAASADTVCQLCDGTGHTVVQCPALARMANINTVGVAPTDDTNQQPEN